MGLPFRKVICASNDNKILSDFIETGSYDLRERPFVQTVSPAMDILASSNLERYLYMLLREYLDHDHTQASGVIAGYYNDLKTKGVFDVSPELHALLKDQIQADFANQEECIGAIQKVFNETGTVLDPHTAVGLAVAERFTDPTETKVPVLVCGTAHYGKFPTTVLSALKHSDVKKAIEEDEPNVPREQLSELLTTLQAHCPGEQNVLPKRIVALVNDPVNHDRVVEKEDMEELIMGYFKKATQ